MPTFITRDGRFVLWSFGNYRYQVENKAKNVELNWVCDYDEALKRFEDLVRQYG